MFMEQYLVDVNVRRVFKHYSVMDDKKRNIPSWALCHDKVRVEFSLWLAVFKHCSVINPSEV